MWITLLKGRYLDSSPSGILWKMRQGDLVLSQQAAKALCIKALPRKPDPRGHRPTDLPFKTALANGWWPSELTCIKRRHTDAVQCNLLPLIKRCGGQSPCGHTQSRWAQAFSSHPVNYSSQSVSAAVPPLAFSFIFKEG